MSTRSEIEARWTDRFVAQKEKREKNPALFLKVDRSATVNQGLGFIRVFLAMRGPEGIVM